MLAVRSNLGSLQAGYDPSLLVSGYHGSAPVRRSLGTRGSAGLGGSSLHAHLPLDVGGTGDRAAAAVRNHILKQNDIDAGSSTPPARSATTGCKRAPSATCARQRHNSSSAQRVGCFKSMVVNHPDRLHEGIADRTADKTESPTGATRDSFGLTAWRWA